MKVCSVRAPDGWRSGDPPQAPTWSTSKMLHEGFWQRNVQNVVGGSGGAVFEVDRQSGAQIFANKTAHVNHVCSKVTNAKGQADLAANKECLFFLVHVAGTLGQADVVASGTHTLSIEQTEKATSPSKQLKHVRVV